MEALAIDATTLRRALVALTEPSHLRSRLSGAYHLAQDRANGDPSAIAERVAAVDILARQVVSGIDSMLLASATQARLRYFNADVGDIGKGFCKGDLAAKD